MRVIPWGNWGMKACSVCELFHGEKALWLESAGLWK